MQHREKYMLEELYDKLPIPLTELSKRSGKSYGTLTRIRDGEPTRKSTINKLLIVFSEIYGLELSTDNVTGFVLEERQQKAVENTENQSAVPQKRTYAREEIPMDLPQGTVKLTDFTNASGISASTIGRWIREGKITAITRDRVSGVGEQKFLTPSEQEKALQLESLRTPRKSKEAIG